MTALQETALQGLNDSYGVASWKVDEFSGSVVVVLDDGDKAIIATDGLVTWHTAAT